MTCVHKVRWSVKRPEDCRFRLSVSHYKDRIVAPDEYTGATEVTPSDSEQVLATTDKLVRDDITVNPAPTEILSTDHNGTFTPSDGKVGFSSVTVDVQPDLRPLSVTENGSYQPDGFDGYSRVEVSVEGQWIDYDDVPVTLPEEYQRVEYIESSGTQFINLPNGFDTTDVISMRSAIDTTMGADKFMVCPTRWNSNRNRFGLCGVSPRKSLILAYGNVGTNGTGYYVGYTNDGLLHDFYYDSGLFGVIDIRQAFGVGDIVFGGETDTLRLFYGYNANTVGKISYFVHQKADNRKIALFACYRKSDGVIGMYDVENDVFYTNDGTGDFTKGQDI